MSHTPLLSPKRVLIILMVVTPSWPWRAWLVLVVIPGVSRLRNNTGAEGAVGRDGILIGGGGVRWGSRRPKVVSRSARRAGVVVTASKAGMAVNLGLKVRHCFLNILQGGGRGGRSRAAIGVWARIPATGVGAIVATSAGIE